MFKKRKLMSEIESLKLELSKNKIIFNYNSSKIEDDFNVLNQILDLKISHYENVVFLYNRYQEEKKVNVSSEELDKSTTEIVFETFKSLSDRYIDYLVEKYFDSRDAMVGVYTQRVYLRLFSFANNYNIAKTQTDFKKSK